jgi:four helix bundle protein
MSPPNQNHSSQFSFESLDVYRCAQEFIRIAATLTDALPRGHAFLADQLRRASTSIPLNIAEACGRDGEADPRRFYGIARGSALECAAILDICRELAGADADTCNRGRELLVRIVQMLTKLTR